MMLAVISYPPITPIFVGRFHLSIHGVFIAAGFIAAAWLATRHLRRAGGDVVKYQSVLSWAFVGALLGARYLTVPAAIFDGAAWEALNPLSGNRATTWRRQATPSNAQWPRRVRMASAACTSQSPPTT